MRAKGLLGTVVLQGEWIGGFSLTGLSAGAEGAGAAIPGDPGPALPCALCRRPGSMRSRRPSTCLTPGPSSTWRTSPRNAPRATGQRPVWARRTVPGLQGSSGVGVPPLLAVTEPRAPLGIEQVPASTRVRTFKAPRVNSRSPQRGPARVRRARPSSVAVTNTPGS